MKPESGLNRIGFLYLKKTNDFKSHTEIAHRKPEKQIILCYIHISSSFIDSAAIKNVLTCYFVRSHSKALEEASGYCLSG